MTEVFGSRSMDLTDAQKLRAFDAMHKAGLTLDSAYELLLRPVIAGGIIYEWVHAFNDMVREDRREELRFRSNLSNGQYRLDPDNLVADVCPKVLGHRLTMVLIAGDIVNLRQLRDLDWVMIDNSQWLRYVSHYEWADIRHLLVVGGILVPGTTWPAMP